MVTLSIVIPTKNRQYTCLYAIETVLSINSQDIEVIIQDCSDTAVLEEQIKTKFGTDRRIKYFYTDKQPSMTENWNMAFGHATGQMICGIGDDDGVVPEIYEIAKWAAEKGVDAVVHESQYRYTWPGFYNQLYDGTLLVTKNFTGSTVKRDDLEQSVKEYSSLRVPMAYTSLPSVYHCLISQNLIARLIKDTGKLLDSTSLDIYTAIAFNKYLDSYFVVDLPFTIKGASPKSNSQRLFTKKAAEHFVEFRNLEMPDIVPVSISLYTTIVEAFIVACNNTGQTHLLKLIDLPNLYAQIALDDPESYQRCKMKLLQFANGKEQIRKFNNIVRAGKSERAVFTIKNAVKGTIEKLFPSAVRWYQKEISYRNLDKVEKASTIIECIGIHKKYLADNHIQFSPRRESAVLSI